MCLQVEKEEKEAQERAVVTKDDAPPQENWAGDAPAPEVSDWASEAIPVSSVPIQPSPFAAPGAPAPGAAPVPTEDWSMDTKDWTAQPQPTAPGTEWGGAPSENWG